MMEIHSGTPVDVVMLAAYACVGTEEWQGMGMWREPQSAHEWQSLILAAATAFALSLHRQVGLMELRRYRMDGRRQELRGLEAARYLAKMDRLEPGDPERVVWEPLHMIRFTLPGGN